MKQTSRLCAALLGLFPALIFIAQENALSGPAKAATPAKTSIPWSEVSAKVGADYQGDGMSVIAAVNGARLLCVFQRLEGEVTREGLWLTSTVTNAVNERFHVRASSVGRVTPCAPSEIINASGGAHGVTRPTTQFANTGTVEVTDKLARLIRPGLTEEYSVSMDGVRQDFIIEQRPVGEGPLRVELAVSGARVEPAVDGARLVLENSGRKIAYGRLRVTDATGKELTARMEVMGSARVPRAGSGVASEPFFSVEFIGFSGDECVEGCFRRDAENDTPEACAPMFAVVVNDTDAVYPIRIDPTFSDANWISMGGIPGADNQVRAAVVDASGNLYIGGDFTIVGDVIANHVAKWNGSRWSALGSGMMGGAGFFGTYVSALALSGSDLYAGGNFTTAGGIAANYIAKWNGSSWSALGSGMNSDVSALAVSSQDVYVGGEFTTAGGIAANYIAKWNGSSWSALGSGLNSYVQTLATSGSDVFAGGFFWMAGGSKVNHIAKWNGSGWTALGSGVNDLVLALGISGSDVYVGGYFTTATNNGGLAVTVNHIAKWNGGGWLALGPGIGYVNALAVSGSDLYAGGNFTTAGGDAANYIAKWNGSSWTALGSGVDRDVQTLAISGSDLYAGGQFYTAGGSSANRIVKWNGSSWSALGSGMNSDVSALAVSSQDVYVGGAFTTAGGIEANSIAKWNGSSWTALGSGMDDYVHALATSGSDVYAGGEFTTAGGTMANHIAKWNGSSWTALGSGMNGEVQAVVVSGNYLYAGGAFTTAGGIAANSIAKWNGSSWAVLSFGMGGADPFVHALAASGSDVYAGGYFTTAGGIAANRIAKWNGSNWSSLGSGMNNAVKALALSGSNVYAGGYFTTAGGDTANHVAKWNGVSWSALGTGMNGPVFALAVSGSDLYAGGGFTTAGGVNIGYGIAKWDGSSWAALGSGMNGYVYALAVSGGELYAGGYFTTAGGKVSAYIARAYVVPPSLSILRSRGEVALSWPLFYEGFLLQQNADMTNSNSWSNANYPLTTNGAIKSATVPITASNQFFRLLGN